MNERYEWSGKDVKDCTRFGMLWRIKKMKKIQDGINGTSYRVFLKRLRRKGNYLYEDGKLKNAVWTLQSQLNEGDMVFVDHDKTGVTRIQPCEEQS